MPITFTATQWVEVIAATTMPLTVIVYLVQRTITGGAIIKGSIQLVFVLLFLPAVLVLGLEKDLTDVVLGALLGASAGFLLANIGGDSDYAPRDWARRLRRRRRPCGECARCEVGMSRNAASATALLRFARSGATKQSRLLLPASLDCFACARNDDLNG